MNNKPNFELLKEAYSIIGGIPEDLIDLDKIVSTKGESLSCETICCAFGWLGFHPTFKALGLETLMYRNNIGRVSIHGNPQDYDIIARDIFNISESEANKIFKQKTMYEKGSHKKVFLNRVRKFLSKHGQLKSQLKAKKV
jgi:hypothetical protein